MLNFFFQDFSSASIVSLRLVTPPFESWSCETSCCALSNFSWSSFSTRNVVTSNWFSFFFFFFSTLFPFTKYFASRTAFNNSSISRDSKALSILFIAFALRTNLLNWPVFERWCQSFRHNWEFVFERRFFQVIFLRYEVEWYSSDVIETWKCERIKIHRESNILELHTYVAERILEAYAVS